MNHLYFCLLTIFMCLSLTFSLGLIKTQIHSDMHFHILLSLVSLSILFIGLFQAIVLSMQNRLLKAKPTSPILRALPPLQAMEGALFVIVTSGVILLSGALGSGFLFEQHISKNYLLPKILLSLLAWGLFICLLIGRYFFGWRGQTAIRWTLCGVILTVLSYFGTKALIL